MKILKKLCCALDTFNDVVGRILSFSILGIVAVIMYEVILRRFLNQPQIWTMDMITMIFGAYTILVLPLGLQHGSFVSVDLITQRLKKVTVHWLALITSIFLQVPFVYYLIPRSIAFFQKSITSGEHAYSVWAPKLWPVKLCLMIGMILLGIQVLSELLKQILWLVSYYKNGRQELEDVQSMSILVKGGDKT